MFRKFITLISFMSSIPIVPTEIAVVVANAATIFPVIFLTIDFSLSGIFIQGQEIQSIIFCFNYQKSLLLYNYVL